MAALVPVTNSDIPVQQLQEQTLSPKSGFFSNKEELDNNDAISAEYQLLNYNSEEERGNDYSFTLNQENFSTAVIDDESCDDSFMQTMNDSAHAFNEQYRVKRDVRETFPNVPAEAFSPEAFLSSIPMFCKISQKRPATIRPKLNTNDTFSYCEYGDADQCYSSPSAGVVIPNKILHSAFFMPGNSQGVPIAPKPCPNEKVSCYVLVVPAPLYYENCAPLKCLQTQQEQHEEDVDFVPSKTHMVVTERTIAPEGIKKSPIKLVLLLHLIDVFSHFMSPFSLNLTFVSLKFTLRPFFYSRFFFSLPCSCCMDCFHVLSLLLLLLFFKNHRNISL